MSLSCHSFGQGDAVALLSFVETGGAVVTDLDRTTPSPSCHSFGKVGSITSSICHSLEKGDATGARGAIALPICHIGHDLLSKSGHCPIGA